MIIDDVLYCAECSDTLISLDAHTAVCFACGAELRTIEIRIPTVFVDQFGVLD